MDNQSKELILAAIHERIGENLWFSVSGLIEEFELGYGYLLLAKGHVALSSVGDLADSIHKFGSVCTVVDLSAIQKLVI